MGQKVNFGGGRRQSDAHSNLQRVCFSAGVPGGYLKALKLTKAAQMDVSRAGCRALRGPCRVDLRYLFVGRRRTPLPIRPFPELPLGPSIRLRLQKRERAINQGIEYIVVRAEAHDSGLCAADPATRKRFSSDLLNLTLAAPKVNRHRKVAKDAAEWLPDMNRCWFADRVVRVRQKYGLTIDRREAEALASVLSGCTSVEMVFADSPLPVPTPAMSSSSANALELWDDNGNGRITCAEAHKHGIAPVRKGHPAYEYMHDADGDGTVCE